MSQKGKISDLQVLKAYLRMKETREPVDEILMKDTSLTEKECYSAMLRVHKKDLTEYGVSLRCGWLTQKGINKLNESSKSL